MSTMPKAEKPAPVAAAPQDEVAEEMTLEEFCQRRSRSDRRVELLSAFHGEQTRAQQFKATEAAFAAALDKFANQPV